MLDDSYNANPDSVRAGIDVLASMPGHTWLVLGDMGEVGDTSAQVHDEIGGYATPVERAGYLQSFLFRAARLVADTGIHTKRWTHAQATDYFVNTVGFARGRSQREVERYCTQPGQACSYKVGHMAWVRARANACESFKAATRGRSGAATGAGTWVTGTTSILSCGTNPRR